MPDRPNSEHPHILATALTAACEFAKRHGVDAVITPTDFGIQRSATGMTTGTYLDSSHAVMVTVDRYGETDFGVATLEWIHREADHDRRPCEPCGECPQCRAVPCECRAGRDDVGNIRLDDGRGLFVAYVESSREVVQRWRDSASASSQFAAAARFEAALALFDREQAALRSSCGEA